MKITIFLTVLLVISTTSFSQKPPRGTQKIMVSSLLTKKDAIEKISKILQRHNLQIASINENSSYITTTKKRIPATGASFSLDFEVSDNEIGVSGKLMDTYMPNTLSKSLFWDIENRGSKGSAYKESFKIMHEIAQELGSVSVYIKAQKK